jgi:predicted PurR-regulated permease PerM
VLPNRVSFSRVHVEFYSKAFFVALAVLVAYGMLLVLQPFAGAMAWAIFLAFLLNPLHRWLTRKLHGKEGMSSGLITGLTPFAVLTPLTLLGWQFVDQARALVHYVRGSDFKLDGSILLRLEQYPVIGPLARLAREELMVSAADIQDWLGRATETALRSVASIGSGVLLGALGTLVAFFFMLFLLFFFLRDGTRMFDRLQRLIPVPEEHREQLFDHLASVTRGVFYGIGLTAICQGIMVGIAFAIAGMPSPVVFGVLAGILALLPAGGAAIVWIPAVLYLAAAGSWGMMIFMLIAGVITSTADNFLRPILVSRYAPVSAFTVFVGVVGGIAAFGAIGIVVGPVFLALVAAILEYFDEKVIAPNKRRLDAQADNERPPPMPGL